MKKLILNKKKLTRFSDEPAYKWPEFSRTWWEKNNMVMKLALYKVKKNGSRSANENFIRYIFVFNLFFGLQKYFF